MFLFFNVAAQNWYTFTFWFLRWNYHFLLNMSCICIKTQLNWTVSNWILHCGPLMCIESYESNRYKSLSAGKTGNISPKTHRLCLNTAVNQWMCTQNESPLTDLILNWFYLQYNKWRRNTGRLWAWLHAELPPWHSAYHVNTCLERRSAPPTSKPDRYDNFMSSISLLFSFELLLSLWSLSALFSPWYNMFCSLYALKWNSEWNIHHLFFFLPPSCVLSVFPAQGTFCTRSEHSEKHHLTQ